ncbi:MAG TPA: branched-chain amino acid aminotransferase [Candidatus Ruthenibacterium merdavium]|uniref:Branched-chain-amino-acid aminotransferase n=1 Tax=Candidatus Ruthenibacterium merdavium TaxID=2838752 RepID=A0A9D2TK97_9FIRM|nr:branched-chain amino acid aminotransferase [Candidatus Ruthenibacterium merdavium]
MLDIKIQKTTTPKAKPDENRLGFGNYYTDHMFVMDYTEGQGWHSPRIEPYHALSLDPAAMVFHYAQESFEGLKAYRTKEGKVQLFRPEKNGERLQSTHERLCIPTIPVEDFVQAVKTLVEVDRDWVPSAEGTSLYLRPFTIATEAHLGVKPSDSYQFLVIASPSGAYYEEGLNPVKIYVEDEYVRATPGGTGFIKCGGNYAASLAGQMKAHEMGYSQVLWLDGIERKYVEEVGSMNCFFKIDGVIRTAPCVGTVLPGITRMSCIELLRDWGYTVDCETRLSIEEVMQAARTGHLEEVFGTGTAAVVSPVGQLYYEGETAVIGGGKIGEVTQRLYDTLTGIQWGTLADEKGWVVPVE